MTRFLPFLLIPLGVVAADLTPKIERPEPALDGLIAYKKPL